MEELRRAFQNVIGLVATVNMAYSWDNEISSIKSQANHYGLQGNKMIEWNQIIKYFESQAKVFRLQCPLQQVLNTYQKAVFLGPLILHIGLAG